MYKDLVPRNYFQAMIDVGISSQSPPSQPAFLFCFVFLTVFVAKAGLELVILDILVLLLIVICDPSPLLELLDGNKGISL